MWRATWEHGVAAHFDHVIDGDPHILLHGPASALLEHTARALRRRHEAGAPGDARSDFPGGPEATVAELVALTQAEIPGRVGLR